jgi:hypothetical protein
MSRALIAALALLVGCNQADEVLIEKQKLRIAQLESDCDERETLQKAAELRAATADSRIASTEESLQQLKVDLQAARSQADELRLAIQSGQAEAEQKASLLTDSERRSILTVGAILRDGGLLKLKQPDIEFACTPAGRFFLMPEMDRAVANMLASPGGGKDTPWATALELANALSLNSYGVLLMRSVDYSGRAQTMLRYVRDLERNAPMTDQTIRRLRDDYPLLQEAIAAYLKRKSQGLANAVNSAP